MLPTALAVLACVVLAGLSVLQLRLALGAPLGRYVWGGRHERELPTGLRVGSAVSVALYAAFAVLLLDRAGVLHLLPDGVSRVATWVLVGYLGLGVLANAASRSRAERAVMTPTAAVLLLCAIVVALG